MFTIEYHPKVLKQDFQGLSKPVLFNIKKVIKTKLMINPAMFGKPLRNTLKNIRSLRVGKYRIAYEIEGKKLIVLVLKVGLREKIYEEVEKRIRD